MQSCLLQNHLSRHVGHIVNTVLRRLFGFHCLVICQAVRLSSCLAVWVVGKEGAGERMREREKGRARERRENEGGGKIERDGEMEIFMCLCV